MEAIHKQKAEKQREKAISDQFEARRAKSKAARERKEARRAERLASVGMVFQWDLDPRGTDINWAIDSSIQLFCLVTMGCFSISKSSYILISNKEKLNPCSEQKQDRYLTSPVLFWPLCGSSLMSLPIFVLLMLVLSHSYPCGTLCCFLTVLSLGVNLVLRMERAVIICNLMTTYTSSSHTELLRLLI